MLLFICSHSCSGCWLYWFQYISCYCLSNLLSVYYSANHHFNTSHVTVYPPGGRFIRLVMKFQYISCYCLSAFAIFSSMHLANFNTSHVTVYPYPFRILQAMVLFQYISCYCLSATSCRSTGSIHNFNTSHVTVYRIAWISTHRAVWISIHLMLLFISLWRCVSIMNKDFNTSHVTVYHLRFWFRFRCLLHFNTSHVTVYRRTGKGGNHLHYISIHLMLLFIQEN